jgi:pimeloyl-ACP methyl ester carboxylesterase
MRARTVLLATALGLVLLAPAAAAYQITGTAVSHVGPLVRTEYTVEAGASPLDHIKFVRLVREDHGHGHGHPLRGSILLLPPLGSSFSFYEQRDEGGGLGTSIAEFFALRNYDVYGYSPRYVGIPAGTCEAGLFDCSVMAGWNLASMVADVAFIRSRIEALHPGTWAVAGGVSLGGILSFAVANDQPGDWDGIIPWEGMLATPDPVVQALDAPYCAGLEAQLAAGLYYDGVGANVFKEVAKQADLAPGGLTPIPLFPPQLTNHQVLVLTLSVPTPGPVSMPVPDYIDLGGSFDEDRFFFASEPRLYENVAQFNGYVPNVLVRDVSCSLAGVETAYVANLGSFTQPVLAIGGTRGFGAYMAGQLAQLGSTDVTFRLQPGFGHIDHFMTPHHRHFVELPILHWLESRFGAP